MAERIFISGQEPDEFPEYQSPEAIRRLVARAKIGDVVHLVPQGVKLDYLLKHLGINQVHGCVWQKDPGALSLWSTYFAMNHEAFGQGESRTYAVDEIRLIIVERAEVVIPRATNEMFKYKSEATIQLPEGKFVVKVDSYFDGIMSGTTVSNGTRITGGASFFKPI